MWVLFLLFICMNLPHYSTVCYSGVCSVNSSLLTYSFDFLNYHTNLSGLTVFLYFYCQAEKLLINCIIPIPFYLGKQRSSGEN